MQRKALDWGTQARHNRRPGSEVHSETVFRTLSSIAVSRSTAHRAAKWGELPCIRIGRRLLVPKAVSDTILETELKTEDGR